MGSKVNPKVIRIGQTINWTSKWYAQKNYAALLQEDILIRKFIHKKLKGSGIEKIEIERSANDILIIITAAKPGLVIGRGGAGIDDLRKEISHKFLSGQPNIKINIQEVDNPSLSSPVVLEGLIADIEKRMPFRRVMKQGIDKIMKAGAQGAKIIMAGRLNGVEIARTETLTEGKVPLHTFRADIDYARGAARTTYGAIGIKVWIYKGEVFEREKKGPDAND